MFVTATFYFSLLSERKILARYDENLMFEEASLCAAIENLKTDEFVSCPVCKRCEFKIIVKK